jgi:hypothetical protein
MIQSNHADLAAPRAYQFSQGTRNHRTPAGHASLHYIDDTMLLSCLESDVIVPAEQKAVNRLHACE